MSRNLRVGLMGGSFDPIHIGHVRIASEARKALDLDRVLFLPSGRPPHKAHLGASAAQRLEMTKLATQGFPGPRPAISKSFAKAPSTRWIR